MALYDKFRIIENHLDNLQDKKKVLITIDNFFDNLINSDICVFHPDFINQITWFDEINIDTIIINIETNIKNNLIRKRNIMRTFIKKENFNFSSLNNFLKNFIMKLEYINTFIKFHDNQVIKNGIKQLTNLIISDSLILIFIEEQVILLNKNLQSEIEAFINLTKALGNYDANEIYIKILKIIGNIFSKHLINIEEYPLPEDIKCMQKISDNINYCKNVKKYFEFIKEDFKIFGLPLIHIISENLINIIQSNTIDQIEFTFDNIWPDLTEFVLELEFEEKYEIILNISNKIIYLIDKVIKESDVKNVLKIINILKYIDKIITKQDCKDIISQKIIQFLNSEELLDQIHITIDSLIYKNKYCEILKLLKFVSNIKSKDIFINKYYQFLIKRLMNSFIGLDNFKSYIMCEKKILDFLRVRFGDKLCYKINKVINDTELSYNDNLEFKKIVCNNDNFDNKMVVITTSHTNWDINQTEGIVTNSIIDTIKDTQLGKYLKDYSSYYEIKYSYKRIINWFPHFGEISITYENHNFIMLPIQFMVIEMFNNINHRLINQIKTAQFFSNYTEKFRSDIINSLVVSGLFVIKNDTMILLSSGNFKSNLIEIFFTNSDYATIWDEQRKIELVHTREEITNSVINTILKNNKSNAMSFDELFNLSKEDIKVFELDHSVFNNSLKYMCKQEYISHEESGKYIKLLY